MVQKEDVKYEIYFTFEVVGDKLFGKAVYPTGEAGILNGTIGQNKISFIKQNTFPTLQMKKPPSRRKEEFQVTKSKCSRKIGMVTRRVLLIE